MYVYIHTRIRVSKLSYLQKVNTCSLIARNSPWPMLSTELFGKRLAGAGPNHTREFGNI